MSIIDTPEDGYEPPYNKEEVLKKYGEEVFNKLVSDPCHKWRMETGIELIHREPTYDEFLRIVKNWNKMSQIQKIASDMKSNEIFGIDNMSHALLLKNEYEEESKHADQQRNGFSPRPLQQG